MIVLKSKIKSEHSGELSILASGSGKRIEG